MREYEFPEKVLAAINNEPALLSMLYDANMMPEQVCDDPVKSRYTCLIAMAFALGKENP